MTTITFTELFEFSQSLQIANFCSSVLNHRKFKMTYYDILLRYMLNSLSNDYNLIILTQMCAFKALVVTS